MNLNVGIDSNTLSVLSQGVAGVSKIVETKVFPLAVRQVYVNGITTAVILGILLGLSWWIYKREFENSETKTMVFSVVVIITTIMGFIALTCVSNMFNPGWAAISNILSVIKEMQP